MGIGGVKAMDGMAGRQGAAARPVDFTSKNIQDEISDVQRQKQGLSSKQELSAEEKTKKRQELQQELSSLNTQLRQRQTESRREQQREELLEEVQPADSGGADAEKSRGKADIEAAAKNRTDGAAGEKKKIDTESSDRDVVSAGVQAAEKDAAGRGLQTVEKEDADDKEKESKPEDIGLPLREMKAIAEGDSSKKQTMRREAVIARMENGIVLLKGEIRQDKLRGADVGKKQEELKKQEQKVQKAASGIPNVKGPSGTAKTAQAKAGGGREKSQLRTVMSSRDGIVIITSDALQDKII